MKIFERKKEYIKNVCKCDTPLPENYKYDKCTICRRKIANKRKGLIGGGLGLLSILLAFVLRRRADK